MTEAEWLTCTEPQTMLGFLRGKITNPRKRRLFACACCRLIWERLDSACWREAVEVAERFADGAASDAERQAAVAAAWQELSPLDPEGNRLPVACSAAVHASYKDASHANAWGAARYAAVIDPTTAATQADLLLDIFGPLPFRTPAIDASWLFRKDGLVRRLAESAYDERRLPSGTLDNTRLAILADALEGAGCTDTDILDHCRRPGVHVRGCWVLDALLGKGDGR